MDSRKPAKGRFRPVRNISRFTTWILMAAAFCGITSAALAVNGTTPGTIETESTLKCIGVKWFISGDDNQNCRVAVDYRPSGGTWSPAQPLFRVEPGSFNSDGVNPGNLLAGSVFGLTPNASYDLRLTMSDPEGGASTRTITVRTRAVPGDPAVPRMRYVIPGSGGGSGTQSNPFRGLAAANASAIPGDVFLLGAGTYTGQIAFTHSGTATSPIVYRGQSASSVILDGQGTARPVVSFPGTSYVHLEQVTVKRPQKMCVLGNGTNGISILRCVIDSSPQTAYSMGGIYFMGPGDKNLYIAENTVKGPLVWQNGRSADPYGIIAAGIGHVICFNDVYNWYDGIDIGHTDTGEVTYGCDVYRNEIHNCTDDGIETDNSRQNVRVMENRITNCLCGISCQPVYGGPVYGIRNVVYNSQLKPLKWHVWPTGMIFVNNTFVGADPRGWSGGQWRHAVLRNNMFLGGSHSGNGNDPIALYTTGVRADLDYDGWYQAVSTRFANFNGAFYGTLSTFRSGAHQEAHGILVNLGSFVSAVEPVLGPYLGQGGYPPPYAPGSQDLRLRSTSPAVNAGIAMANLTDGYSGTAPDLGAYELGSAVPVYGPGAAGIMDIEEETIAAAVPEIARQDFESGPNPFTAGTALSFDLPRPGKVLLGIYDPLGRRVRTILNSSRVGSGRHVTRWDGRDEGGRLVPAGIYYGRLETEATQTVRKLIVVR